MTILWMLGGALVGRLVVANAFRAAFGDPAVARRELRRFPPLRVAEITAGPARLTGRVVAVEPPLASPLAGEACVFHQLQLRRLGLPCRNVLYPSRPVQFELDDGTGRALVRIPPPPPPPEPGDEPPWEVVCAIGDRRSRRIHRGESDAFDRICDQADSGSGIFPRVIPSIMSIPGIPILATEGIIAAGDVISVGGLASTEIAADSRATSHRTLPTRIVVTSANGYRLAVVKPG